MITPTIGRQVWYFRHDSGPGDQAEAATVVYVHNERMVNLQLIGHSGDARAVTSVLLRQPEDEKPESNYCEWMPYQKGQAARTEAVEQALRTGLPGKDAQS